MPITVLQLDNKLSKYTIKMIPHSNQRITVTDILPKLNPVNFLCCSLHNLVIKNITNTLTANGRFESNFFFSPKQKRLITFSISKSGR